MHNGYDADMDVLTVKMTGSGNAGDPLGEFSVGFVDGLGRSLVMHGFIAILNEMAPPHPYYSLCMQWCAQSAFIITMAPTSSLRLHATGPSPHTGTQVGIRRQMGHGAGDRSLGEVSDQNSHELRALR